MNRSYFRIFGFRLKNILAATDRQHCDAASSEADEILTSGYFDEVWYRERYSVAEPGERKAVENYLSVGDREDRAPHPLFAERWYREQHPDVGASGLSALTHFIRRVRVRDTAPSPLFDPAWYRKQAGDALPTNFEPFLHFLRTGGANGISPHPAFDSKFYVARSPDLMTVNPLTHFVECGALQGLRPNKLFDVSWYLNVHRELRGDNPLAHFLKNVRTPGLQPHPDVDLDALLGVGGLPDDRAELYLALVNSDDLRAKHVKPRDAADATRMRQPAAGDDLAFELDGVGDSFSPADGPPPAGDDMPPFLPPDYNAYEFVSFDIWDTILRRDCHPDEIKLQSARAMLLLAWPDLRPAFRDIAALFQARRKAENSSAPNDEFEYRFADALDKWLETVLVPGTSRDIVAGIRQAMTAHEFQAELRATRPDIRAQAGLSALRAPAVYASDFYHSSDFMGRLLDAHGLGGHFVRGYVSSDTYTTKRSGRMFDKLVEELSVAPDKLLHVGDNLDADVRMAKTRGVRPHLFKCEDEARRQDWFGKAFHAQIRGDRSLHIKRVSALFREVAARLKDGTPEGELKAIGARLAPLPIAFCLATMEDALCERLDKIFFFSREGIFFKRVY